MNTEEIREQYLRLYRMWASVFRDCMELCGANNEKPIGDWQRERLSFEDQQRIIAKLDQSRTAMNEDLRRMEGNIKYFSARETVSPEEAQLMLEQFPVLEKNIAGYAAIASMMKPRRAS